MSARFSYVLSAGVYSLTAAVASDGGNPIGLPPLAGKLTIRGEGAESTIIERRAGAPPFRILTVMGELTLAGVTLRGGGGDGVVLGGAIRSSGILTVTDSVITQSAAREGAGLEVEGETTITNTTISNNRGIEGGGILVRGAGAMARITGSTFSENSGQFGGGLGVQLGGAVRITNHPRCSTPVPDVPA